LNKLLMGLGVAGALTLSIMAAPALALNAPAQGQNKQPPQADDVPAPPMALLFGIGAAGLIWGRRLASNARKAKERAEGSD
jgi:hypothetical protein